MAKRKAAKVGANGRGASSAGGRLVKSQRALAARFGVSGSTVAGWVKRDDWPVSRTGPWDEPAVARIAEWRHWLQEDRSGKGRSPDEPAGAAMPGSGTGGASKSKVDTLLKYHRMREAKVRADEAEGRVIDRELLDRALAGLAAMFISATEDLQDALPYQLAGDPVAHQAKIREVCDDMRRRLAAHQTIELAGVEDEIAAKRGGRGRARGRPGGA